MFVEGLHADLKSSVEAIGTCIAVFERRASGQFELISANAMYGEVFGGEVENAVGQELSAFFPRYVIGALAPALTTCVSEQRGLEIEIAVDGKGRTSWWRMVFSPVIGKGHRVSRVINTALDITDKKNLEKSLELSRRRYEALVNSAYDGIVSVNGDEEIQLMNQAALDMFGMGGESGVGRKLETLLPHRFRGPHQHYVAAFKESPVASRPMHARAPVLGLRRDGSEFPVEITIAKIKVGEATEMTAVLRDISERARLIEELRIAAAIDPLTGIFNRRRINEALGVEMQRRLRFGHVYSVLLIDIDFFKKINDRFGHQAGDTVLVEVVARIRKVLREVDLLGRWGGEEFLVVLPETDADAARTCAERIRKAVGDLPLPVGAHEQVGPTVSIGVASVAADDSIETLIGRADAALYRAKDGGRNRVEG